MIPWAKIIGAGALLYAAYLVYRGEIDMTNKRRYNAPKMIYKRSENPVVFWGLVLAFVGIGIFVLTLD
jgi:hypothetical protein